MHTIAGVQGKYISVNIECVRNNRKVISILRRNIYKRRSFEHKNGPVENDSKAEQKVHINGITCWGLLCYPPEILPPVFQLCVHYVTCISQHPNTHLQHGVHVPPFTASFIFCSIVSTTQTNFMPNIFIQFPIECVSNVVTDQLQ